MCVYIYIYIYIPFFNAGDAEARRGLGAPHHRGRNLAISFTISLTSSLAGLKAQIAGHVERTPRRPWQLLSSSIALRAVPACDSYPRVEGPHVVRQDSSKGGAVETGCSDFYDVIY